MQDNLTNIEEQIYVDPQIRQHLLKLLEENSEITNFEAQVYRQDGTIIWISENTRAVYDELGKFLYYEGTVEELLSSAVNLTKSAIDN